MLLAVLLIAIPVVVFNLAQLRRMTALLGAGGVSEEQRKAWSALRGGHALAVVLLGAGMALAASGLWSRSASYPATAVVTGERQCNEFRRDCTHEVRYTAADGATHTARVPSAPWSETLGEELEVWVDAADPTVVRGPEQGLLSLGLVAGGILGSGLWLAVGAAMARRRRQEDA